MLIIIVDINTLICIVVKNCQGMNSESDNRTYILCGKKKKFDRGTGNAINKET